MASTLLNVKSETHATLTLLSELESKPMAQIVAELVEKHFRELDIDVLRKQLEERIMHFQSKTNKQSITV